MVDDLLALAREKTERSEPSVRVAAWMRIARVEMTIDRDAAHKSFRNGLEAAKQVNGQNRSHLLQQAQTLAAAMDPALLGEIPANDRNFSPFGADMLVGTMSAHGHAQAAFDYAMRCEDSAFPYTGIVNLMFQIEKEEDRLALLRRAIQAWRGKQSDATLDPFRMGDNFLRLFQFKWKLLAADEAREVLREIVRSTLEQPDQATRATYHESTEITSMREHKLFELLHVIRHLDGPLADSLIADHAQLAAAARRYPNGMETMQEEAEELRKQASNPPPGEGCDVFVMSGSREDRPYLLALKQASQDGDFGPALEYALEQYREDSDSGDPNLAPKEFWPSMSRFRGVLHGAGKRLGSQAHAYLDRIPDEDIRLLAMIEFAAALARLPELSSTMQVRRPRRNAFPERDGEAVITGLTSGLSLKGEPMRSPDGSGIRCPKCKWQPHGEIRWICKCGHVWNTFWTHGLCPSCQYQWAETGCHQCHKTSAHTEWYVPN